MEDVVVNVVGKRLAGNTLQNVTRQGGRVVRVCRRRERGEDALRQMCLYIVSQRRQMGGIGNKKFLRGLFEPGSMGHDVAQSDRLREGGWNLEIEIIVDIPIQIELALLDLLHDRGPIEQF